MKRIKLLSIVAVLGLALMSSPAMAKTNCVSRPIVKTQKPDLTVTSITFSNNHINQTGTMAVTIKNVGDKPLTNTQGLLNTYFNLPSQSPDWQFDSQTPMMSLMTTRPLPTPDYPLMPGESISRLWLGKFTEAGNYYMYYRVDNANELDELNENNNSLSAVVSVN